MACTMECHSQSILRVLFQILQRRLQLHLSCLRHFCYLTVIQTSVASPLFKKDVAENYQYLRLILTSRVYEVVKETPLTPAINLSNRLECKVLLKREDLQPVFSFKLRGAYNKMAHLDPEQRWKGVVACSAGE